MYIYITGNYIKGCLDLGNMLISILSFLFLLSFITCPVAAVVAIWTLNTTALQVALTAGVVLVTVNTLMENITDNNTDTNE